jgi:hypothetical protein
MKYREKIKTRRGTIAGRNIRSLAFLGIFLIVGVCLIAGRILYERNIEVYTNYAYSDAHLIADSISGITPTKYLETQTKDAEYYDIRYTFMTAGIYQDEFRDFYLVVPTEDDLIYISEIYHNLPAGSEDLSDVQAEFLEHRPYRPDEKEAMMQALSCTKMPEEEKLFVGLRELGGERLATALVPVRSMENEVPALVGIDVSIAAIWEAQMNLYIMLALTIIVITSVGIVIHYQHRWLVICLCVQRRRLQWFYHRYFIIFHCRHFCISLSCLHFQHFVDELRELMSVSCHYFHEFCRFWACIPHVISFSQFG